MDYQKILVELWGVTKNLQRKLKSSAPSDFQPSFRVCNSSAAMNPAAAPSPEDHVDMLSTSEQNQLRAIACGKSNGVSTEIVRMMRSNVSAAAIEAACCANLYSWFGSLKIDWQKRVQFAANAAAIHSLAT